MDRTGGYREIPASEDAEFPAEEYWLAAGIVADRATVWAEMNRRLADELPGPDCDRNEPTGTLVGHRHEAR
jgi:selenophosphate synthase